MFGTGADRSVMISTNDFVRRGAFVLVLLGAMLAGGCGSDGNSGSAESGPAASIPVPERVQAKINNDASNVAATISIDGGAEQAMTISGGSASFQANGLTPGAHTVVITFYQTAGDARIVLAKNTSQVNIVAGQTSSVGQDGLTYDTASFNEDGDLYPNVEDDDNDNDGLSDEHESIYGLNPFNADSDGDNIRDGDEVPVLAIATPVPSEVQTKIATNGVQVVAAIAVGSIPEQEVTITNGNAVYNVPSLLPGDHTIIITFYQIIGAERIVLARHTAMVTVVAGQAASLGDGVLSYETAFNYDNDAEVNVVDFDNDNDGLTDSAELTFGTNPLVADSDSDGVGDNAEITRTPATNPLDADSDDDNLNDGAESTAGTNPLDNDSDDDGLTDGDEIGRGTNPLDTDSDDDGISDSNEVTLGINPLTPDSATLKKRLSGTGDHTCLVLANRELRCWGDNEYAQLGSGPSAVGTDQSAPVAVIGIANAKSVHTSISHSCAQLTDGSVKCWGSNVFNEISDINTPYYATPENVPILANAADINMTFGLSCAVPASSNFHCRGDITNVLSSVTNKQALSLAAGAYHSCFVLPNFTAECIGDNLSGQLGNLSLIASGVPVPVNGISTARTIAVGAIHSCALLESGAVRCWGSDADGQLGDNSGLTLLSSTPVEVNTINNATAIALGADHSCALLQTGSIKCWGRNTSGQLGDNSLSSNNNPVTVPGITNAVAITAGTAHTCALLVNGRVMCWGANDAGQLGNGSTTQSSVPVFVSGF